MFYDASFGKQRKGGCQVKELGREAREAINLVKKLYYVENRSREEIREYTGLSEKALNKIIESIEDKKAVRTHVETKSTEYNTETVLEEYSNKQMSFLSALQNGELIKKEYSNNWAKISGELVKEDIKNAITLSMATNVVYPNKLKELIELRDWHETEIKKAMNLMSYDTEVTPYKVKERIDTANYIVRTKIKAMGIKGNKDLSELIQTVGNLNVAEEKLMTEKVKNATDESQQENVLGSILEITQDINERPVEVPEDMEELKALMQGKDS